MTEFDNITVEKLQQQASDNLHNVTKRIYEEQDKIKQQWQKAVSIVDDHSRSKDERRPEVLNCLIMIKASQNLIERMAKEVYEDLDTILTDHFNEQRSLIDEAIEFIESH